MHFFVLVLKRELTDSLERGRETKPSKSSQLVGFSSECSRWLLGFFRCYNSEKYREPQIPAGWRNNDFEKSCSNLVFVARFAFASCSGFSCPGWSFHQAELLGRGKRTAQQTRGKLFFIFFFIFGELCHSAFLALACFPASLQELWERLAFGGHSNTNLGRELCAQHVREPALVPLLQIRWDLGDLQFSVKRG